MIIEIGQTKDTKGEHKREHYIGRIDLLCNIFEGYLSKRKEKLLEDFMSREVYIHNAVKHELGYVFGLGHCEDDYVMGELQDKSMVFCPRCGRYLSRRVFKKSHSSGVFINSLFLIAKNYFLYR